MKIASEPMIGKLKYLVRHEHCDPSTGLVSALVYTAIASLTGGMVGHGVYFIADRQFGFSPVMNLVFGIAVYLPYIPGAMLSGPLTRAVGSTRLVLLTATLVMSAATISIALLQQAPVLWIMIPLYSLLAGVQWPIVESYITAGRHGADMRRSLGLFNVTWAICLIPAFWIVGLLINVPGMAFVVLAVLHVIGAFVALRFSANPPPHDADIQQQHVGQEYQSLLRTVRILLPASYVLLYSFTPLLPSIWDGLEVDVRLAAILSSTWMVARLGVFLLMIRSSRWHGRWSLLLIGAILISIGFGLLLSAGSVPAAMSGLAIFGFGQGMLYYCALYYGMAVGHAQVESGGVHEAVIGCGYTLGPTFGLIGHTLTGGTTGVIALVWCLMIVAGIAAILPYRAARRSRVK